MTQQMMGNSTGNNSLRTLSLPGNEMQHNVDMGSTIIIQVTK